MSFRFNEDDVATSGANKILQLDATGKIPALDGSNITNISASGYNGLSYAYTTDNNTDITPAIDRFYYIPQANTRPAAGGNVVNINVPYSSNVINGSKIGWEYISVNGATAGGKYTITTPLNSNLAAQGWTSFELFIDGTSYSDGAIFYADEGANRSRQLYAYVNGTDLKWFEVKGGNKKLSEIVNFDLNSTNAYAANQEYVLATKFNSTYATDRGTINVKPYYNAVQFNINSSNNVTMNLDTNMPSNYRTYFISNVYTGTSIQYGGLTLPAATTSEGIWFNLHRGQIYGSDTNSNNTFIVQPPTGTFRWGSTATNPTGIFVNAGNYKTETDFVVSDGSAYYAGRIKT